MTNASEPETMVERVGRALAEAGVKMMLEARAHGVQPDARALAETQARAAIAVVVEEAAKVLEIRRQLYLAKADKADPFAEDTCSPRDMKMHSAEAMDWAIAEVRNLSAEGE